MRDILVMGIFFVSLIPALRWPYIAAMLWVWIGLMNPHRLSWGFAYDFPFALLAALMLLVSMVLHPQKVRLPKGAVIFLLVLLVIWMGCTTMGAIAYVASVTKYIATLKVLLMTILVAAVVRSCEEILGLVVLMVGSIAFYGIKGGFFTIGTGGSYRVWGPPSSVIEGNNELAVALIITMPLLYFMAKQAELISQLPGLRWFSEKWIRTGCYMAILLCLASALGTYSRGALLALAAMSTVLWWRGKSKLVMGVCIFILLLLVMTLMPDGWFGRMNTISTYSEDASAMGRINAWTMAINIANDRLLGAGFETALPEIYMRYAPDPDFVIVAHSIYFQILGEHGYIGLILYLSFWFTCYAQAGRVFKLTLGREDLYWAHMLASMAKVSLVGFAVGGAFLSLAYWDMPFYIMVILVCTQRLVKDTLEATAPAKSASAPIASTAGQLGPKHARLGAQPLQKGR